MEETRPFNKVFFYFLVFIYLSIYLPVNPYLPRVHGESKRLDLVIRFSYFISNLHIYLSIYKFIYNPSTKSTRRKQETRPCNKVFLFYFKPTYLSIYL